MAGDEIARWDLQFPNCKLMNTLHKYRYTASRHKYFHYYNYDQTSNTIENICSSNNNILPFLSEILYQPSATIPKTFHPGVQVLFAIKQKGILCSLVAAHSLISLKA